LFESVGFAIWNNTWYGGHYLLSYSVLFPPLAALLSPIWAAAVAAVASAWLFDGLVRDRWGPRAAWGSVWFGALGAVALLGNGWLVFALGVALVGAHAPTRPGGLDGCRAGCRDRAREPSGLRSLRWWRSAAHWRQAIAGGRGLAAGTGAEALLGLLFPGQASSLLVLRLWQLPVFCARAARDARPRGERDVRMVVALPARCAPRVARPQPVSGTSRGSGRCSAAGSARRPARRDLAPAPAVAIVASSSASAGR
jgi:hypothetical protein